jgi:hypothetical protein
MEDDCFLCAAAFGAKDLAWHDRPLWLDPRAGLMVAGLGGFSPGYVLIAPLVHELNLRRTAASQADKFTAFVEVALGFLVQRFGPVTFWEHGAPSIRDTRRSTCIDHAHLHAAPGTLSLPKPPLGQTFSSLGAALTEKTNLRESDGYLLLGWTEGNVVVGADVMVSQYYRREWAKAVGRPDEWDYLVAEDSVITKATIRRVFSIFGE